MILNVVLYSVCFKSRGSIQTMKPWLAIIYARMFNNFISENSRQKVSIRVPLLNEWIGSGPGHRKPSLVKAPIQLKRFWIPGPSYLICRVRCSDTCDCNLFYIYLLYAAEERNSMIQKYKRKDPCLPNTFISEEWPTFSSVTLLTLRK